jgi:hypothetical protein
MMCFAEAESDDDDFKSDKAADHLTQQEKETRKGKPCQSRLDSRC